MSKLKVGSKSDLKYFGYEDIKSWAPCYDPVRHVTATWRGTAIDILKNEAIPFQDRLWAVLRTEIISERVMRLFAVWSYRQTLVFVKNPDPRSLACAAAAESFANGEVSIELLAAARSASEAASEAARSASEAAYYAARYASEAAYSAARSASEATYSAARSSAYSAARSAESAQRDKLIEMIQAEAAERKGKK